MNLMQSKVRLLDRDIDGLESAGAVDKKTSAYILTPELDEFSIQVVPVTIYIARVEQDREGVLLLNVPPAFNDTLEKKGFYPFDNGWLRNVDGIDERFWRPIFGDKIQFIRRPSKKHISTTVDEHLAPPPALSAAIRALTDEHIAWILKHENIVSHTLVRRAVIKALNGCYSYPGVWPIIKVTALNRLELNPEDQVLLSYLWDLIALGGFDSTDVPATLSVSLLLKKVIERGRLTAAVQSAISDCLVSSVHDSFVAYLHWDIFAVDEGHSSMGPMIRKQFTDVTEVSKYLLENSYLEKAGFTLKESVAERVYESVSSDNVIGDWADSIAVTEMPRLTIEENPAPETTVVSESNEKHVDEHDDHGGYAFFEDEFTEEEYTDEESIGSDVLLHQGGLSWPQVYIELDILEKKVSTLFRESRVIATFTLEQIKYFRKNIVRDKNTYPLLHELFGFLFSVVDMGTLVRQLKRHNERAVWILSHLCRGADTAYFALIKCWSNPTYASAFINSRLEEDPTGESRAWWLRGYRIHPVGEGQWGIYQDTGSGQCVPIDRVEYESYGFAMNALRYRVRISKLKALRAEPNAGVRPFYLSGSCLLDCTSIPNSVFTQASTVEAVDEMIANQYDILLHTQKIVPVYRGVSLPSNDANFSYPPLFDQQIVIGLDAELSKNDVYYAIGQFMECLGWSLESFFLDDRLRLEFDDELHLYLDETCVYSGPYKGVFAGAWAGVYFRYCLHDSERSKDLAAWLCRVSTFPKRGDVDYDFSESVIMEFEDVDEEVLSWVNQDAIDRILNYLESPTEEGFLYCCSVRDALTMEPECAEFLPMFQDAVNITRYYQTYLGLYSEYKELLMSGATDMDYFVAHFCQWLWQKSRWQSVDVGWLVSAAENSMQPGINYFPDRTLWFMHGCMEQFVSSHIESGAPF